MNSLNIKEIVLLSLTSRESDFIDKLLQAGKTPVNQHSESLPLNCFCNANHLIFERLCPIFSKLKQISWLCAMLVYIRVLAENLDYLARNVHFTLILTLNKMVSMSLMHNPSWYQQSQHTGTAGPGNWWDSLPAGTWELRKGFYR